MIHFEVYHHKILIKSYTSNSELDKIKRKMRIWKQNFQSSTPFTLTDLYDEEEQTFPVGFLVVLEPFCKKESIQVDITDLREYPLSNQYFKLKEQLPLYETQKEALDAIKLSNEGIISSVTGSGKSRLILETIVDKGVTTLVIVPTKNIQSALYDYFSDALGKKNVTKTILKEGDDYYFKDDIEEESFEVEEGEKDLLSQLSGIFKHTDYTSKKTLDIGSNQSKVNPEDDFIEGKLDESKHEKKEKIKKRKKIEKKIKPVTIACYQSLRTASKYYLQQVNCVLIDECHHGSAVTILDGLMNMKNAAYRFYFSGTPWRDLKSDLLLLAASIGNNIIYELRGAEGVEKGIISKPKLLVINPPSPKVDLRKISGRQYRKLLELGIIGNVVRNICIVDEAVHYYQNQRYIFIAVNEIKHIKIIEERLKAEGISPILLHGELSDMEMEVNLEKVRESKEGCVCIGTMAVGEGTDLPNIDVVILGAGGKSTIRFLQRIGRGTRKTSEEFIVIDIKDWYHPTLFRHFRHRERTFKEEFDDPKQNPLTML